MKRLVLQSVFLAFVFASSVDAAGQGGTINWVYDDGFGMFFMDVRIFDNDTSACDRTSLSQTNSSGNLNYGNSLGSISSSSSFSYTEYDCVDFRNDTAELAYKADVRKYALPGSFNNNYIKYGDLVTKLHIGRKYYNGLANSEINFSPAAGFLQLFTVMVNETLTFTIAAVDAQYDYVKCRFATSDEGQGSFLKTEHAGYVNSTTFILNEATCSFTFTLPHMETETNPYEDYGVALMMEDYISPDSTDAMSSIPIQFRIRVYERGTRTPPASPTFISNDCVNNDPTTTTVLSDGLKNFTEFSPRGTYVNGSNVVYHDSHQQYNKVNIYCYASMNADYFTQEARCDLLKNTNVDHSIDVKYEPFPGTNQLVSMNAVVFYFLGAVDGLSSGNLSIYKTDDDSLHLTKDLTTCQNLGGNRLKCEWTAGTNLFASNASYYITYTAIPGYDRSCGSVKPITSKNWNFTTLLLDGTNEIVETNTSMAVYADSTYATPAGATVNSYLGQFIFVQVNMYSALGNFGLYNCFVTDTNDINSATAYYLIQNGCDTDDTVKRTEKTSTRFRFNFEGFQFLSSVTNAIYLHCQVKSCSSSCTVSCGARKRRSIHDPDVIHAGSVKINVDPYSEFIEDRQRRKLITKKVDYLAESTSESDEESDEVEKCLPENFRWMVLIPYASVWVLGIISYSVYRSYNR